VWTPEGLSVAGTRDAMDTSQIADLVRKLNTVGMLGSAAIAQEEVVPDKADWTLQVSPATCRRGTSAVYALYVTHQLHIRSTRLAFKDELKPSTRAEDVSI
jgi:hypothetical protein